MFIVIYSVLLPSWLIKINVLKITIHHTMVATQNKEMKKKLKKLN